MSVCILQHQSDSRNLLMGVRHPPNLRLLLLIVLLVLRNHQICVDLIKYGRTSHASPFEEVVYHVSQEYSLELRWDLLMLAP